MTTQNIYSMVDTWDDAGTTFKGISLSVTDTASASGSLLMDLQVGGVTQFALAKNGTVVVSGTQRFGFGKVGSSDWFNLGSAGAIAWGSTSVTSGADLSLLRDAADTLAQRRSTNPQAFRISNTHTDLSNYERGKIAWESNVLRIGTEKAGTGSARALELQTDGVTRLTIDTSGHTIVTSGRQLFLSLNGVNWQQLDNQMRLNGGSFEMVERTAPSAPAANGVRIYAEDDGAGKTRLMALFATGAAQQIAIEP